ncbi:MAG: class II aldolase/adducin family protein [Armatimonadetes bacterium]|nr:class II aldolase/adducin family protein [Armatimonadota bacterium]MDE2207885.1 class II aldolase/adducin family protein [Armatimonadota bacterium]
MKPPDEAECRRTIAQLGALLYQRRMLDSAGGNISARCSSGDVCISPRFSGSRRRWMLDPEEVLLLRPERSPPAAASRETGMHLAIYKAFPNCGAVIHAHPRHLLVFASACRPLAPPTEQTDKYGVIPVASAAPAHSAALAKSVVEALEPQQVKLKEHSIACLLPRHGITVAGPTLDDAYDALERLEGSARVWIDRASLDRLPDSM